METDAVYFARRSVEEREAAMKSRDPKTRQRHLEFAAAYEFRGREITALERRANMQLVSAA